MPDLSDASSRSCLSESARDEGDDLGGAIHEKHVAGALDFVELAAWNGGRGSERT